jgi:hypothetical protein
MIRTMAMPNSFLVLFVRVLDKFSEKKIGKVGKFEQISKIIIFVCLSIITDNRSYIQVSQKWRTNGALRCRRDYRKRQKNV